MRPMSWAASWRKCRIGSLRFWNGVCAKYWPMTVMTTKMNGK